MQGNVEVISHIGVSGWAVREASSEPAVVEVLANGQLVASGRANAFRADLARHGLRSGFAYFEVPLNLPLGPEPIEVSVRTSGSEAPLPGAPVTLPPLTTRSRAEYQAETRRWLDQRFAAGGVGADGIYVAHQPIYGFRGGHCEPNLFDRYVITWNLMQALADLRFDSLLDVGGAEGYKAALARHLFGCNVMSCDLSGEACRRAEEIYALPTLALDIHKLPFSDESHDVVVASETIEHVIDYAQAVEEMMRVARKAVVITVPHESFRQVAETQRRGELHGHIHYFDLNTFNAFTKCGVEAESRPMIADNRVYRLLTLLMEGNAELAKPISRRAARWLERAPWLWRAVFNRSVSARLLEQDRRLVGKTPGSGYKGVLAILLKDPDARRSQPVRTVRMRDVLDFQVPYHRPDPVVLAAATKAAMPDKAETTG